MISVHKIFSFGSVVDHIKVFCLLAQDSDCVKSKMVRLSTNEKDKQVMSDAGKPRTKNKNEKETFVFEIKLTEYTPTRTTLNTTGRT